MNIQLGISLKLSVISVALVALGCTSFVAADPQGCPAMTPDQTELSLGEHMFGGVPWDQPVQIRRGFVMGFDSEHNVPAWAAWRAAPEYRSTPPREGRWATFRVDRDVSPVRDSDYVGWFDAEDNFARGHIVPYFIAGGDRNYNGIPASVHGSGIDDIYDACTVFEINSMPNIAPQFHNRFNGSPGVWWLLETDIRHMVDGNRQFQVIAGSVFADADVRFIGNRSQSESDWRIGVPHGFFKIVIDPASRAAVGFLFDHDADIDGGCDIDVVTWPSQCIVSIERIEAVTGLSFFGTLPEEDARLLRAASNTDTWMRWVRGLRAY